MRFDRYPRPVEKRERTPRRVAAAKRAVQKEKDSWALFPAMATHQTAEERLDALDVHTREWWRAMRQNRADSWRRARRALRRLPDIRRAGLVRYWQTTWGGPKDPVYLLGMIREASGFVSFWGKLAHFRRLKLIGEGRLPRPWVSKR